MLFKTREEAEAFRKRMLEDERIGCDSWIAYDRSRRRYYIAYAIEYEEEQSC